MKHYVHFSEQAITQLLLNGFEAFVIRHGNNKRSGIEMHASLYGWQEETSRTLHHHIEFLSVDTSAKMTANWVQPNAAAQLLKAHLAEAVGYTRLGGVHTHPYLLDEGDLSEARARLCDFSDGDRKAFECELVKAGGETLRLEVLLTIKQVERLNIQRDGYLDGQENVFEFAIGNCKCFLRAQAFTLDEYKELVSVPTVLKCDFLQKFKHVGTDFGRVRTLDGQESLLEHRA